MSRLFLFLGLWVLGCLGICPAGSVTVAWTASPSPDVGSYRLYAARDSLTQTNLAAAPVRVNVGTNLSATIQFTNTGTWHLVATAVSTNHIESEPSNQLTIEVPAPAHSLRTLAVEHTLDLSNTNGWQDVGFFRIRIEPP